MQQKKTLEINTFYFKSLIISFITSYLIVLILCHFGTFDFIHNKTIVKETPTGEEGVTIVDYKWDRDDPLVQINFLTVFGSRHFFPPNGWKVKDVMFSQSGFFEYSNKFKYYNKIVIKDFKYVLVIWVILMSIIIFFKNF